MVRTAKAVVSHDDGRDLDRAMAADGYESKLSSAVEE